jgi:hypothetical protein
MSDADGNRGLMGGFPGDFQTPTKTCKKTGWTPRLRHFIYVCSSVSGSSWLSRVSTTTRRQECEAKWEGGCGHGNSTEDPTYSLPRTNDTSNGRRLTETKWGKNQRPKWKSQCCDVVHVVCAERSTVPAAVLSVIDHWVATDFWRRFEASAKASPSKAKVKSKGLAPQSCCSLMEGWRYAEMMEGFSIQLSPVPGPSRRNSLPSCLPRHGSGNQGVAQAAYPPVIFTMAVEKPAIFSRGFPCEKAVRLRLRWGEANSHECGLMKGSQVKG